MSRSFCMACDAVGGQSTSPVFLSSNDWKSRILFYKYEYIYAIMHTLCQGPACLCKLKSGGADSDTAIRQQCRKNGGFFGVQGRGMVNRDHRRL